MTIGRFQRAIDGWLESLSSPNTRAAYERDLDVYASWVLATGRSPSKMTVDDIEFFRDHCLASGSSPATVNRRLAAVSSFYRYAGPSWSTENPAAAAGRSAVAAVEPVAIAPSSADRVWAAAVARGGATAVIVALVLLDGYKTKDLLALDVTDVQWRRGVASVGGQALSERTAVAIRSMLAERRSGPLLIREFASPTPDRLTRFGVDYLIKRVGADAGLRSPLTVNALRAARAAASGRGPTGGSD